VKKYRFLVSILDQFDNNFWEGISEIRLGPLWFLIRNDPKIGHGPTLSQWHKQIGTGCACANVTSTTCPSGTSILEQVVFVPLAQAGWLYQTCSIGSRRGQKRPLLVPWHKSCTHDGGLSLCHGTSSIPRWSLYLFHLCQLVPQSGSTRPWTIRLNNLFASALRNDSGNWIVLLSAKTNPSVGIRRKKHRQPVNKPV